MGLQLPQFGTIVVNGNAKVGKYCRMHVCTNIGASAGSSKAPKIGDYVYIAPGVKIYADIEIADRIAFAANAAVGNSFLNPDMLIGGVPAKELGPVDI
jgi:serine O-acetyltransferase